ncbi:MAG TPA: hypothetical protein VNF28_05170 [Candidatus Binataceae bacterium]|nr:hypothetical protein [Candidatus Binataceae bacterium]
MRYVKARKMVPLAILLGVLFFSSAAIAQTCMFGADNCIDIHIDGIAGEDGNGNYDVATYNWGLPGGAPAPLGAASQLNFTRSRLDTTTVKLMHAAANHRTVATADLSVISQGTVTVSYHMIDVQFESMQHSGQGASPNPPVVSESVILGFKKLVYTFQPVTPNGQKAGPPVTFTWNF